MNKLLLLLLVIALMACVPAKGSKLKNERTLKSNVREQERVSAEHQAQEQQEPTERDSTASPGTSPEKPYIFKSQAQKFQPPRVVPMPSPINETPSSTPTPSEPRSEK